MKNILRAMTTISILGSSVASAATLTPEVPGGIAYRHRATMEAVDSVSFNNSVGAWSWEDETLFAAGETPVGWTHQSAWVALTLTSPAMVTLRLESAVFGATGTNLIPGFTIFTGLDNDTMPQAFIDAYFPDSPDNYHTYNNRSNVIWAEDMTYLAHVEPNGTNAVEQTFSLPAGQYSVVLGGNANSTTNPGNQGYLATITTVPEPGSAVLAMIGGLAFLVRRQRRH